MVTPTVPLVSVVLPTYNRAATLPRSIGSVLAQSWTDLELIVVDDGSTDTTPDVVRAIRDPRVRYVARANGGVAAARNTGVQAARGRYVAFQDSDDEWLPGKLAAQLEAMQSSDRRMVVCGLVRVLPERVRVYPPAPFREASALDLEQIMAQPLAYTQSWLAPRQAIIDAGGFDETLRVWDDWELLMRLASQLEVRLIPEPLVRSEASHDSISRQKDRFIQDMEKILSKHAVQLRARPASLAQLKYTQGWIYGFAGRAVDARAAFIRALRLQPLHWRAAVFLLASLTGSSGLQRVLQAAANRTQTVLQD